MRNKIVEKQVQNHFGGTDISSGPVEAFIKSISESFDDCVDKIKKLEAALEKGAGERRGLVDKLQNETAGLTIAHKELSRIFNQVNEGFFSKDIITNKYIHMSVGCEKIYGYTVADFYANSLLWFQVIHPDDRYLVDKENEELEKGNQTVSAYRILCKDKTIKWIEVKAIPEIAGGRLSKVEGVVNDITERKKAEKLLTDSEIKYRSFFANNMDGILLSRPDGAIEEANPAACEMFGATEKEICAFNRMGLLEFADEGLISLLEERTRTGKVKGELNFFRLDGSKFRAEISSTYFKDADGEQRTCVIIRDITERKKAEAALLINERQLDLIYNNVDDGIFMLSIEKGDRYKFISVNQSFLQLTGLTNEQVVGKYANELIPSPSIELVLEKYRQAINTKKTINWEEQSAYPSGVKSALVSVNPVMDERGDCIRIIGSVHDITERKKREDAIKKSELKFQNLVNTVDGIVWEADAETLQFSFVSKRAEALLGYPVSDWIETAGFWKSHIHPEDRDWAASYCIECIDKRKSHDFEYRMIAANGQVVWLQDFVSIITNEDQGLYLRGIMIDITARKKSEKTIRDGEEKYSSLIEQAADGIFIDNLDGRLVVVNKSGTDMLGYTREEFALMRISDIIPVAEHADAKRVPQNALKGQAANFERNLVHKNGSLIPADISIKMLSDGRLMAIVRNISERRLAEKNIREALERFQRFSQATHDAIWDWNLLTNEVWWNKSFFKLLGFDNALTVPGLGEWIKKIHPDERARAIMMLRKIGQTRDNFLEDEFRYQLKDGNYGTGLGRAYILRDNAGRPIRITGAIMDITERKKTEQLIVDSEQRYRQIVETAQEGIWLVDENNITTFVNKKMGELLGYSPDEIIGKPIFYFMDIKGGELVKPGLENSRLGISGTLDFRFITKSGAAVWTSLSNKPIFDSAGIYRGALAMVTDITQRKLDEDHLKKSQVSLDLKNRELKRKNTELEQFAYVASHDLQEPLRTTASFVQLLQKQYKGKLDEKADKYLNFIVDSSDRMKVLIKDLLDYSRIGNKHELERVDCNQILLDVTADLQKAISDASAKIISEDLPIVSGYATEIKQLFQNLLTNAIKFSQPNSPPLIKISVAKSGGFWDFSFADNGIGIDKVYAERIFIIFQRLHTRSEYEGSGIGLSHCKKIVELHHGKIWVESLPGEGSVFHFTIPETDP